MASFNRVILMGNLTRDPQLKYLPNNTAVCEFGLAMNRRFRDRDGNQHEEVCFVDVTAFGRQGETINQYMSKGRQLMLEGRLKYDTWTSQDGGKRSKLSVVLDSFQFVGDRSGGGDGGSRPAPQRSSSDHDFHDEGPGAPPAPEDNDIPF